MDRAKQKAASFGANYGTDPKVLKLGTEMRSIPLNEEEREMEQTNEEFARTEAGNEVVDQIRRKEEELSKLSWNSPQRRVLNKEIDTLHHQLIVLLTPEKEPRLMDKLVAVKRLEDTFREEHEALEKKGKERGFLTFQETEERTEATRQRSLMRTLKFKVLFEQFKADHPYWGTEQELVENQMKGEMTMEDLQSSLRERARLRWEAMGLTEKEGTLLDIIWDGTEIANAVDEGMPWTSSVIECSGLSPRQARSILSSLIKKGLVRVGEMQASLGFTELAYEKYALHGRLISRLRK